MNKYQVHKPAFIKKNSSLTIQPGIYNSDEQQKDIWDYLLSLKNVCSKIEKEEEQPRPKINLTVNFERPDSKENGTKPLELKVENKTQPQSKPKPKRQYRKKSTQKQGD